MNAENMRNLRQGLLFFLDSEVSERDHITDDAPLLGLTFQQETPITTNFRDLGCVDYFLSGSLGNFLKYKKAFHTGLMGGIYRVKSNDGQPVRTYTKEERGEVYREVFSSENEFLKDMSKLLSNEVSFLCKVANFLKFSDMLEKNLGIIGEDEVFGDLKIEDFFPNEWQIRSYQTLEMTFLKRQAEEIWRGNN